MLNQKSVDIAIIGAMREEIEALIAYLTPCEHYEAIQSNYYRGQLQGKEVIVFQSGVGKVSAAIATAFVITQFAPKYVINIGSAGGFEKHLCIGDVVISLNAFYHDVDVTLVGCEFGQIPGMPTVFAADPVLIKLAKASVGHVSHLNVMEGSIGTGDYFMADEQAIKLVRHRFPNMIAADMEAAAIAHTCYLYQTPFVVIRAISDLVDDHSNKVDFFSFLQQAAANSAKIVVHMIGSV